MKKEIICTVCPRGCHIIVDGNGEQVSTVEGYGCKRGLDYASSEYAHPVRILTTTVKMEGIESDLLPVRSSKPLPKELILDCMDEIRKVKVSLPVAMHSVIIENILGTGADIIATKAIEG